MPHYVTAKRNSVEKGVGRRYTAQQHQVTLQSINGFQNITFIFHIYLHVYARKCKRCPYTYTKCYECFCLWLSAPTKILVI